MNLFFLSWACCIICCFFYSFLWEWEWEEGGGGGRGEEEEKRDYRGHAAENVWRDWVGRGKEKKFSRFPGGDECRFLSFSLSFFLSFFFLFYLFLFCLRFLFVAFFYGRHQRPFVRCVLIFNRRNLFFFLHVYFLHHLLQLVQR